MKRFLAVLSFVIGAFVLSGCGADTNFLKETKEEVTREEKCVKVVSTKYYRITTRYGKYITEYYVLADGREVSVDVARDRDQVDGMGNLCTVEYKPKTQVELQLEKAPPQ